MESSGKYNKWKPGFIKMMQKYVFTRNRHLLKIIAIKQRNVLSSPYAPPINFALYRAGPRKQELEREEVAQVKMTAASKLPITDWSSPRVFVPKNNGSLRFCVRYRRPKAVTVRDSYPMPLLNECIDCIYEAKMLSTSNASSGRSKTEINEWEINKTAFVIYNMLQKFPRKLFGF